MRHRSAFGLVLALALVCAAPALATRLVFEPATGTFADFGYLPAGYGNRVAATTQDGFLYDLSGGPTPSVAVDFGAALGAADLFSWSLDFGDLQHMVFAREPYEFEMRFVADPGHLVALESFDMAGWPHLDFPSIASVVVLDGLGDTLYVKRDVYVFGATTGSQHTHFALSGVHSAQLRLKYDSRTDGHGLVLDSDDVGIDNIQFSQITTTGVPGPPVADGLRLEASAPNPCRGIARLQYSLPRASGATLAVFDVRGRRVRLLQQGALDAGPHAVQWDSRDEGGRAVPSGLYFVKLECARATLSQKLILSR